MKRTLAFIVFGAGLVAIVAACGGTAPDESIQDVDPNDVDLGGKNGSGGNAKKDGSAGEGGAGGAAACGSNERTVDVSSFAKCLDGGRCVPSAAIPEAERKRLNECTGGFCVPEIFLATGGNYVPKSCASLAGGEGRCLSRLFKDIDAQKDQLPQDVCEASERCAPCYDPTNGALTGACNLVSCDAPKKPKTVFKDCCLDNKSGKPGGRCVPKSLIPQANQGDLDVRECDKEKELCAPAEQLDPAYVPPKCKASATFGGTYDGVCISDCIHKEWYTSLGTAQGNCKAGTFCAPCKNPITGEATGAPGCTP